MFKKFLWSIVFFFSFLLLAGTSLFVFHPVLPILEKETQEKIKEGKFFWEWQTQSHGPLAVHYVEKGTGPEHIFFLHGFRSYSYTWKELITPLADKGYHVWAFDLVGYGLSDKPVDANYNIDFFVEQLRSFMEANGIEKAHLAGNSMGGGLALSFALKHGHLVESLTLMNALGYPMNLPFHNAFAKYLKRISAKLMGTNMIRYGLEKIVYDVNLITDEKVDAYCLPYMLPGGIEAAHLTLKNFENQQLIDMVERYPTLKHPMLVIWGDHDTLIPVSYFEKFKNDFPHCQNLLIEKCGHIPQEEAPEVVLNTMIPFLKNIKK